MTPLTDILTPCLDEQSDEPIYRRLYLALREAILQGRIGHRLPSTRRLAADLSISRNSVAAAYDLLIAEGYLSSRVGAGSFVAESLPDQVPAAPAAATIDERPAAPVRLSRASRRLARLSYAASLAAPFEMSAGIFTDFPWPIWSRLLARPWRRPTADQIMRYDAAGLPALRRAVADMLGASRAMSCSAEQVLITGGSQQALDIACRLLIDPGDKVMVEDPGYDGVDAAVLAAHGELVPQPVDEEGLIVPETLADIRAVVVTPSRNFPLGTILSLPRRLALLQAVAAARGWIIEDDYDAGFRFAGRPLASMFGLDRARQVLYAGSFSRTLFPAVRLGYLVVPEALIDHARAVREASDGGEGTVIQMALAAFIEEGHYGAHIRRQRLRFAAARRILTEAIETQLGDWLEVVPSDGGLSLTALFRHVADDRAVAASLVRHGIAARPLSSYYRDKPGRNGLVLTFAGWPDRALREAVRGMAVILTNGS